LDSYGRLYYFGGKNGTNWYNTLFYQDTGVPALQNLNPTGSIPSPRAYHGMAVLDTPSLEGVRFLVLSSLSRLCLTPFAALSLRLGR
jgi:hypothetical protein